jgi:SAM-dependent methyltransferase
VTTPRAGALLLAGLLALPACRGERPGAAPGRAGGPGSAAASAPPRSRPAPGRFTFAVMGCAHLGLCDPGELRRAVLKMKEHRPDFVQFLGSTVDATRHRPLVHADEAPSVDERELRTRWRQFDEVVRELGVPVYEVPSEDSIPSGNVLAAGREFRQRFGERYGTYVHKNNLFIRLDSEARSQRQLCGFVDGAQYEFLNQALAKAADYDHVFVFVHQSAWALHDTIGRWFTRVHPLLEGKVEHVFGAGGHYLDQIRVQQVHYTTTGSAGCRPTPTELSGQRSLPHFLIVEVNGKDVRVRPIAVEALSDAERRRLEMPAQGKELLPSFEFGHPGQASGYYHLRMLTSSDRRAYLRPDAVLKDMALRPGMRILDLGAGAGFFTFRMAAALGGTGEVYATEVVGSAIDELHDRARQQGLKNVRPVRVSPDGVDPFYRAHKFDLILLSSVYSFWDEPDAMMAALAGSLTPNGRVYLIHERAATRIMAEELDPYLARKRLREEKDDFPVTRRLSPRTRALLGAADESGETLQAFVASLAADLTGMLDDRALALDLLKHEGKKSKMPLRAPKMLRRADLQHGLWLMMLLSDKGVIGGAGAEPVDRLDRLNLQRLNRIFLTDVFQLRFVTGATVANLMFLHTREQVLATMKRAGLKLRREAPDGFLPYHHVMEFGL